MDHKPASSPPQGAQPPEYQMHNMSSPPDAHLQQQHDMPPPGRTSPTGMPPQKMAPPPMQQQQQFDLVASPYRNLQAVSGQVWCPRCGKVVSTVTQHESGGFTHVAAFIGFWVCWLCCVPYMMDSCKDVVHKCPGCPTTFATWHRSGRTDVHVPEVQMPVQ